ncbi:SPFH domain-containing protein, partial [Klebsiella michiganensis]
STITVRSADGFKFNLDVSQIIHIPRNDAPKVIARFGDMAALVTQVLEPTIGNYFRNSAQDSDIIDFLRERSK